MRVLFALVKIAAALSVLPFVLWALMLVAMMVGGLPGLIATPLGLLLLMPIVYGAALFFIACFAVGRPKWYVFAVAIVLPIVLVVVVPSWTR